MRNLGVVFDCFRESVLYIINSLSDHDRSFSLICLIEPFVDFPTIGVILISLIDWPGAETVKHILLSNHFHIFYSQRFKD